MLIALIDNGLLKQHYVNLVGIRGSATDGEFAIVDYRGIHKCAATDFYYLMYNNTLGFWHFNGVAVPA